MKTQTFYSVMYSSLAFLLVTGAATALAETSPVPRVSESSQGQGAGDRTASLDEYEPLLVMGNRNKSKRASRQQRL